MSENIFDIPVTFKEHYVGSIQIELEGLREVEKKVERLGVLLHEVRELAESLSETAITVGVITKDEES